jgi:hypothetical protein
VVQAVVAGCDPESWCVLSGWASEWSWGAALAAASIVSGLITLWKILDALKDIQRVLWTIGGDPLDNSMARFRRSDVRSSACTCHDSRPLPRVPGPARDHVRRPRPHAALLRSAHPPLRPRARSPSRSASPVGWRRGTPSGRRIPIGRRPMTGTDP